MNHLDYLFEQFKCAFGYEGLETTKSMMNEFIDWILNENNKMGKKYLGFLDTLGINYNRQECVEIGKGKYDSVVSKCETTIISTDDFVSERGLHIIAGFKVYNAKPILACKKGDKKVSFKKLNTELVDIFMTQNPYDIHFLDNWDELHNNNLGVIVGIFGNIHDKDLKVKREQLIEFKNKLYNNYLYESITDGETYCDVVASSFKTKKLVK